MTRIASSPSRTATRSLLALPPVLVVAALLMVACGGGGGGETPGATTPVDEAPSDQGSTGRDARTPMKT